MKLIYLAGPYTRNEEGSFDALNRYAARLIEAGFMVFSPISHTHPIAMVGSLPTDFEYWKEYNFRMIKNCDVLVVLMLRGWKLSTGVTAEIKIAEKIGVPVKYHGVPDDMPVRYAWVGR